MNTVSSAVDHTVVLDIEPAAINVLNVRCWPKADTPRNLTYPL
jgi:hypothetical protein